MKKLIAYLLLLVSCPVAAQNQDHNLEVAKNLEVFNTIYKQLDLLYVDTLDAAEVVGNGIDAMLNSLDPYTVYYPEDKTKDLRTMITGKYAGIGAIIKYNQRLKTVVIEEPYAGMPAAEAGLRKGDIILSIDGEQMNGKTTEYVSDRLKGDPGTTFELRARRPGEKKEMSFRVTRRAIQLPAVPYYGIQQGGIGYINLNQFTENSARTVRNAFIEMRQKGIKGLVLDLRNNGGGSEPEAVDIVNLFVPKGKLVVSNRGKLTRANRDYRTTLEPVDTLMPLVVLVNGGTASASEITSGALQDMDRAVVMGTRTYGKGLVQMTTDLPYNGRMKLTTSKYYIPSGRCIQAVNYKHANGGYTEHVPDSLTRLFHTANGREVRDGGGIKPDVEVKADTIPNIAVALTNGDPYGILRDSMEVLHDFEVAYIASHPSIGPAASFEISDADYEEFKQKVLESGFSYDRESEKYLKNIVKLAKFEGYYDVAKPEFDALEKKLTHNVARDLDYNKAVIKQILSNDIVTAYYFQGGGVQNSLRADKQMKAALQLLGNPDEYRRILSPVKTAKK
ncbi:S41 family peptidase [Prevotella sp. kh1p2]|uniref:S41 family peptidase n=1 Tax=Prevotella sp. kh1p2 TaxID=1761883 RepID=UPI0008C1258D|nr:S41 family peptidase [Prevotella sp. kh1p2]SES83610.1 carboxyl-terminal processing protease [Prevotella sp. kh1p2]SNU10801.1 carboxyl-terminal processing protease [Prevotellaceae bacterium KH2P17]